MCRYCACELSKQQLSKQCAYKKNNQEQDVPWSTNKTIDYQPSNTLQPKDINGLPVILDGKHLQSSENRLFCPMYWSLVPSWYKDDLKEWTTSTHNARVENLHESKIYSASLKEGKRCVVVMEGFYEFKKSGSQPAEVFYIHSHQNNLLKAAGLFSSVEKDGETLLTCTVITTESDCNVSQVHHRVPVLLNEDADMEAWLDFKTVSSSDAVAKIKSNGQTDLKFYKTNKIGSREPAKPKKALSSTSIMMNWLKSGSQKGLKRKIEDE